MKNMKISILIFSTLLVSISVYADISTIQSSCEQKFSNFYFMVMCLRNEVRKDPTYQGDNPDSNLIEKYLQYADQLASQVNNNSITENQAHSLLDNEYNQLKSISNSRQQTLSNGSYSVQSVGVIDSYIKGNFEGWSGDTIFQLDNGQIWQQSSYSYYYHYAYHPKVVIYPSDSGYTMKVENVDQTVFVKRIK